MDHQIEITVTEHGHDPDSGDRLVGAFYDLRPEVDAVVDQNVKTGDLTATFILDAEGAEEAVNEGLRHFMEAARRAGLHPTTVLALHADACRAEATEDALVPAL